MPRCRQVPTLEDVCLQRIRSFVVMIIRTHFRDFMLFSIGPSFESFNLPFCLCTKLAVEVLKFIYTEINCTKERRDGLDYMEICGFSNFSPYLKEIDFNDWPIIAKRIFIRNLDKMNGLEHLSFSDLEYPDEHLKKIASLKGLRSFASNQCSDSLIQVLADNCPFIEKLDFYKSKEITDRSVPLLLKCKNLKSVDVAKTSITCAGYAELVVGLPKLENISYKCTKNNNVIKYLYGHHGACGPFGHIKMAMGGIGTADLEIIVDMFPELQEIRLEERNGPVDFTVLSSLNNLEKLELTDYLDESSLYNLFKLKGNEITSLSLRDVERSINMDNLLAHICHYCLKLKCLVLSGKFTTDNISLKFKTPPFINLESLIWNAIPSNYLEFILDYALNIRYLTCNSIEHVVDVLKKNPMEQL